MFLGQDTTNSPPPICMENFPWPSSLVVIVVPNPWKVDSVVKGCEAPHNLSLKNAQAHREHIEKGKSSKFYHLCFDSCLCLICTWVRLHFWCWTVLKCWSWILEQLTWPLQRSSRQHRWSKWIQSCDSRERSQSTSPLVVVWAQNPGAMNEAACSTLLEPVSNHTNSSIIRALFLQYCASRCGTIRSHCVGCPWRDWGS